MGDTCVISKIGRFVMLVNLPWRTSFGQLMDFSLKDMQLKTAKGDKDESTQRL